MNLYKVYADYTQDTPKTMITFSAVDLPDACFKAAQKIIDKYSDLSDESCNILSNANPADWNDACDEVYDKDGLNISDISERIDEEE